MQKNYYQVIGVANDATTDVVRALHMQRRRQFAAHPEVLRLLDEAALVLTDPELRQAYDQTLRRPPPVLPIDASSGEEKRSGRRGGHFFLLGILAAAAYGWYSLGQNKARPTPLPPAATAASAEQRPAREAVTPANEETIISLTPIPPMPTPAGETSANETPKLIRPEKKPGFDPAYMAWTVYQIVGAKVRGSGVMLERDKIITNCHVIAGSYQPRSIVAINSATHEAFYPEKIAILSDSEDVCLLQVAGAPDYIANWGSARPLAVGAQTYTVSFPGREGLTWSAGNLLGRANVRGLNVLLTSNYCRPGVSGGPLFDGEGNVIGITSAGRVYRQRSGETTAGECISIEAETAKEVMWRTLFSLAMSPVKYEGVWGGGR